MQHSLGVPTTQAAGLQRRHGAARASPFIGSLTGNSGSSTCQLRAALHMRSPNKMPRRAGKHPWKPTSTFPCGVLIWLAMHVEVTEELWRRAFSQGRTLLPESVSGSVGGAYCNPFYATRCRVPAATLVDRVPKHALAVLSSVCGTLTMLLPSRMLS